MKSKASFFNLKRPFMSSALMKENLRKIWPLCLLLFLVYFLSIVFMAFMKGIDKYSYAYYAESCLTNSNPLFLVSLVVFPILASVVIFKYLHKEGATTVIHSMPFTRSTLFFTNYLTGVIILTVPMIINGFIMALITRDLSGLSEKKAEEYFDLEIMGHYFKAFSGLHVFNWVIVSMLIMLFIYTLSVFAGMVSGNIALHVINAVLVNFAPVLMFFIVCSYLDMELFGFSYSDAISSATPWFSPLFDVDGVIGPARFIFFLLVIIIGIFLTNFLYGRRKLEKAGDSLVFRFMGPVVAFIIAFMGTALLGMYVYLFNGKSDGIFYAAIIAASIVWLIIANMIVQKTPRIFNKKTLLNAIIYTVIVAAFMCAVVFDIFGLETKVPAPDKVKSVTLNSPSLTEKPYTIVDYSYMEEEDILFADSVFKSKDAIKYMTALQSSIVNDKKLVKKNHQNSFYDYSNYQWSMKINYDLAHGNLKRDYALRDFDYANNQNLLDFIDTPEYRKNMSLATIGYDKLSDIEINMNHVDNISKKGKDGPDTSYEYMLSSYTINLKGNEKNELLAMLDKDFKEQTAKELMDPSSSIFELNITRMGKTIDEDNTIVYAVSESYDNTIKWMKEKGYYNKLVFTSKNVEKINVEIVRNEKVIDTYSVTDPDEINALWKNRRSEFTSYGSRYAVLTVIYDNDTQKRIRSFGMDGEGEGSLYGRYSLDSTLSYENTINRFYIEKGNPYYEEMLN